MYDKFNLFDILKLNLWQRRNVFMDDLNGFDNFTCDMTLQIKLN